MITEIITGFDELALGADLKITLSAIGYRSPTPIQATFIPLALQRLDLIGQARTGTGKTAAFLIPALELLDEGRYPQALILAPTRELVQQVVEEGNRLKGNRDLIIAPIYGGQSFQPQIKQLQAGAQIVVGTPGRLLDLMQRGTLKTDRVKIVVIDEADRMLDIGFRPDLERILRRCPTERQTLLLSATMPPPVLRLAQKYMHEPRNLNLSTTEVAVKKIVQKYVAVREADKTDILLRLLVRERPRQALVFCQMKIGVRKLAAELSRRVRGVMAIRGDMPQSQRNRVMDDFRQGRIRILVATDVVGRGIDVDGISHVINYDIPEDAEAYVHRIGRTGRMGRDGKAFTFVVPHQGKELTNIEMFTNQVIERDELGISPPTRKEEPEPDTAGVAANSTGQQQERDPLATRLDREGRRVLQGRYRKGLSY